MPKTKAKAKTKAAATTKRTSTKKRATKKASKPLLSQLRIERRAEDRPFLEFRITEQTLYWLILGVVSIVFALWILTLDARVQKLYDEIDANSYSVDQYTVKKTTKAEAKAEE